MTGGPGLQPQRTALAWNRTALTGLGLLGAVAKVAADRTDAFTLACLAVVLAHTVVIVGCATVRARSLTALPSPRVYLAAYASTLVAGLAAAASIIPTL